MNFNIHNIFKFKIEVTNKRILKYLNRNYSYFKTDEKIKSELDIIVTDFIPSIVDCHFIDLKYYARKNYLFCNDNHKLVKWSFCLKNIDEKPTVYFKGGLFSEIFLKDYIIEPLIGFKLAQKGYSLLHASSIVIDGKGLIFIGGSGVGKTSIILNLLKNNATFLADEAVLLSNKGMIYSLPLPLRIYNHNVIENPYFSKKITLKDKFQLKLKYFIYLLSLNYANFPQCIEPEKIFNKIENKFQSHSLILLSKTTKKRVNLIKDIDKKEFVKQLILVNKYQYKRFFEYLCAYSFRNSKSEVDSYWQILYKNLFESVEKSHCYQIEIPLNYNYNSSVEFENQLNEIVSNR